ncbi:MAG: hypothetical protein E6L09_15415 [Verrucomicrobia bacterium]|nr:MAG: hypothetical protein E6L09_15415 [Verrucomicrobiota bacterium]
MFASKTLRRLAVLAVALNLLTPAAISSRQKPKSHNNSKANAKKEQEVPDGIPSLWRRPSDVAARDLYWGPGGKSLQPDLTRVTLIEKEKGGYSTKYRVRDASGREWRG